jgi:hypothetical protein
MKTKAIIRKTQKTAPSTLAGIDVAHIRVDQAKLTEIANARKTLMNAK